MPLRRSLAVIAAVLVLLLAASLWALRARDRPDRLVVAAKNFTESRLLAEIMALAIERRTGRAVERTELGSTGLCYDALRTGAVHLYPEYTGTLMTELFALPPEADQGRALAAIRRRGAREAWLAIGQPFGLDDTYVLAMRRDEAERLGIHAIGDLAGHGEVRAGFTGEFLQRPDGWPGLAARYGLHLGTAPVDLAPGHMYQAVRDRQVDLISAFSTDARIARFDLVALRDDRGFFPSYRALPLLRTDIAEHDAGVVAALGALAGRIDDRTMRALNAAVDLDGRPIAVVAREFLDRIQAEAP